MMGRTHALTGIAAGVGTTYLIDVPLITAVLGSVLCAGAALAPDIDHRESTVTKSFGPVTQVLSYLVRMISGGHRAGTHSILGIVLIGTLAQFGVMFRHVPGASIPARVVLCVLLILCFGGVIRLLKIPGWFDDLAPIPIVISIVCFTAIDLSIVPWVLMLGCAVHVAGDVVTKAGCPLWWPLSAERVRFPLFRAGGSFEYQVVTPVVVALIIVGILGKLIDIFPW